MICQKKTWMVCPCYVCQWKTHPPFVAPAPYNSLISPNEMPSAHTLDTSENIHLTISQNNSGLAKDMVIGGNLATLKNAQKQPQNKGRLHGFSC